MTFSNAIPDFSAALWYEAPFTAQIRREPLRAPKPDEVLIRTLTSAISRGTERLIASGLVPEGERERMRCPMQAGDFPFPVKYGYCAVGIVVQGPEEWRNQRVFVLHPHQDWFIAPISMLNRIPEGLSSQRAALAANMETALNAIWDSGASAADRIVIVGGGLVGLLITYLAAQFPGAEVTLVDINPKRAALAKAFGAGFALPEAAPSGADVVFHTSASAAGLATALGAAGMEGQVIELSWYGDQPVPVPLGGLFHAGRVSLRSSQVGTISPGHAPRWSYSRRLQAALALLSDERLDLLISETLAFHDLPAAIPRLLAKDAEGLVNLIAYPA
jgi:threonine dehydrogenase-like Zn-dependent dehydrogenase